jgi:hypothetical protein
MAGGFPMRRADRSTFVIPDKEKAWLRELAWRNRMSEAEVIRLLIRDAAKRAGLPDPDKLPANALPLAVQTETI